jgi:glutathione-regulated potassium-efflux system ancillary protein KefC
MDPIWLALAFVLGLLVRLVKIPPLVGYLLAGFLLKHFFDAQSGEFIEEVSDLGVSLLLFIIGLKLKIKKLARKEIWAGASVHMLLTTALFTLLLLGLSYTSIGFFGALDTELSILLAFALSFSSTVFAVKVLEENDEVNSMQGIVSIGVLIIQDIFAVLYIVFAAGKLPNIYALGLPVLLLGLRPVFFWLLKRTGYGELLILYGFFMALVVGAALFEFAGLKADLGALIVGVLIANHPKSKDLADKLSEFKDFFLIGFFLSIGLTGEPSRDIILVSIILALAVNFKVILYFFVFTRFRLRARTSVFTSLTLANYSEFGLIVGAFAVSAGLMPADWLTAIAVALSLTFVVSSVLNNYAHHIYFGMKHWIHKFETHTRLTYDEAMDIGNAEILVIGMGKLGTAAYDQLSAQYGQKVLGIDYNADKIKAHQAEGRNVSHEDSTDGEFWDMAANSPMHQGQIKMVMLCMDSHKSNLYALERLHDIDFQGKTAAVARYDDQAEQLSEAGADAVYNIYSEAGFGFADHACKNLEGTIACENKI